MPSDLFVYIGSVKEGDHLGTVTDVVDTEGISGHTACDSLFHGPKENPRVFPGTD